ncbi:Virginiamycin B lyase [BD1-7 clade bacterium]|uniref:Virginiamycin B lyase n=1 Tax=BD1-7 clade bacterium TaxID=2029982 RepID=A0A5S9NMS3_9GAMM|nr:Virginiamycin B lyase [BD1-7 clade bacterium]
MNKGLLTGVTTLAAVLLCAPLLANTPSSAQTSKTSPPQFSHTVFPVKPGDRPHDVAPAPNGLVWYTAQKAGALGILDPSNGDVRHIKLGQGSAPHGVIQGPAGNAWITDGGLNAIVRYAPDTEAISIWFLPEHSGYANLNTAAFDGDGVLWFTGQEGIYGSLNPANNEMAVYKAPGKRGPYGITGTPDGRIFYASLAGNYIGEINTTTGKVKVIPPPTKEQGARRVWTDSKGDIWVSEWNTGQLSRYTPKQQRWQTWKLPGEQPQAYAVYVDETDKVWVSDFGGNRTWIFDPATEDFIGSIPGSDTYSNVRQILGRDGEVWLPESGVDRLMRVSYPTLAETD